MVDPFTQVVVPNRKELDWGTLVPRLRPRLRLHHRYEQAGIHEYWLLDPQTRRAEFYQLGSEGQYHLTAPDKEGVYRSAVLPGFWLRVDWLWQRPLPRVLDVLRELGVL